MCTGVWRVVWYMCINILKGSASIIFGCLGKKCFLQEWILGPWLWNNRQEMVTTFISVSVLYLFTHGQGPDLCIPTSWPLIFTQSIFYYHKPGDSTSIQIVSSSYQKYMSHTTRQWLSYTLLCFRCILYSCSKFCIKWVETYGYAWGTERLWLGVWACLFSGSDSIRHYAYLCSISQVMWKCNNMAGCTNVTVLSASCQKLYGNESTDLGHYFSGQPTCLLGLTDKSCSP
jgi:hypothetical protein